MIKMPIVRDNLENGIGSNAQGHQTLVQSDKGNFFVVSSVSGGFADETYIFPSNKEGEITNWGEVWGIRPNDHKAGLKAAETEEEFYEW